MSIADIEERFRSGSITKSDCEALKRIIVASDDESTLESAIYIYGRSCSFDRDVLEVCKRYLVDQPVPGLTAVCMRTALDDWDLWEQYPEVLTGYLNIDLYDEWYDEVLFACRFCSKLSAEQTTTAFACRLTALLDAAKREGISELLELANVESDSSSHERDRRTH
jgi:hypothetical protein